VRGKRTVSAREEVIRSGISGGGADFSFWHLQGCLISVAVSSSSVFAGVRLCLSEVKMMVGLSKATTTLDSHFVYAEESARWARGWETDLATLLNAAETCRLSWRSLIRG